MDTNHLLNAANRSVDGANESVDSANEWVSGFNCYCLFHFLHFIYTIFYINTGFSISLMISTKIGFSISIFLIN